MEAIATGNMNSRMTLTEIGGTGSGGYETGGSSGDYVPAEVLPLAILLPRLVNPFSSCYVDPTNEAMNAFNFSLLGFGDVLMPGKNL